MSGSVIIRCMCSYLFIMSSLVWAEDPFPVAASSETNVTIPEFDCVMEPSEIIDAGSAVPGILEAIYADRSDVLKKGAVIARLESRAEEATLQLTKAQAEATASIELRQHTLNLGEVTAKRNKKLLGMSAISEQDMDTLMTKNHISKLEVQQERHKKHLAELEYQRAEAILERRIIRSPVDGVVMERFKTVGEYLEDEPVLRVAKLDPLFVEAVVPIEHMGKITTGMKAEVLPQASSQSPYVATVERVDRIADAASGTFGVRLSLSNADYAIAAGLRCKLAFLPPNKKQRETIAAIAKGNVKGFEHHWVKPSAKASNEIAAAATTTLLTNNTQKVDKNTTDFVAQERVKAVEKAPTNSVAVLRDAPLLDFNFMAASVPVEEQWMPAPRLSQGHVLSVDQGSAIAPACYSVGPIESKGLAEQLADKFTTEFGQDNTVVRNNIRKNTIPVTKGYFVLAGPAQSDEVTEQQETTMMVIERIKQAGITDYMPILVGANKGRVSFGYYRRYKNAIERQAAVVEKGVAVEVVERSRNVREYWLDFSGPDEKGLKDELQGISNTVVSAKSLQLKSCGPQMVSR